MVVFIIILCLSPKLHFFNYPQTSSLSLKVEAQEGEEMQTHAREAKVAFRARPLAGLLPEGHLKLSLGRPKQAPENPNGQGMPTKSPPQLGTKTVTEKAFPWHISALFGKMLPLRLWKEGLFLSSGCMATAQTPEIPPECEVKEAGQDGVWLATQLILA